MSNKIDERMSTADGLLAGLFGAVVVIASFMLLDMARGAVVAAPAPEGGADLTAYFWRTMATGGMLFENRYGRERWRSHSMIGRRAAV